MSSPLQRLRMVIDNVVLQSVPHHPAIQQDLLQEEVQAEEYHCHHYTVEPRTNQKETRTTQLQTQPAYSKAQVSKLITLYQREKQKATFMQASNDRLLEQLRQRDSKMDSLHNTFTLKGKQLQQATSKSMEVQNDKYLKLVNEKEKLTHDQINKLNDLLDDITKQLNSQRHRYNTLGSKHQEAIERHKVDVQSLSREIQQQSLEIQQLRNEVAQRKRIIQLNIQGQLHILKEKQLEQKRRLSQKDGVINGLRQEIRELNEIVQSHIRENQQALLLIDSHEQTMSGLMAGAQESEDTYQRNTQELNSKIETLLKLLQEYQNVERRNQQLQLLIQEEKSKQKYHIVEVRDETQQLQCELLKSQVKQLLRAKAIAEQKLKLGCTCMRTTVTMKDNSSPIITTHFLKGHQIRLVQNDNKPI